MKTIRVAFLGSRPLGSYCLEMLRRQESVEIVAHVVREPNASAWWKEDPYYSVRERRITHEELAGLQFDLGVSMNYWRIIEHDLIKKPRLGFINIHHSYNLALRGRDMATRAILNARTQNQWFHGTTLHYTDDGLDTGPIINSLACPIYESDTAWTLFQRTETLARVLVNEWIPRLLLSRAPTASPETNQPLQLRKDLGSREVTAEGFRKDPLAVFDMVRAYDFNGYFPQAHIKQDNAIIFLTTDRTRGRDVIFRIDDTRVVYSLRPG